MDKALNARLLLGVTGGIAAYKVAELTRLLQRNNVDVRVAMTDAATKFVTAATFQALSGKPVVSLISREPSLEEIFLHHYDGRVPQ